MAVLSVTALVALARKSPAGSIYRAFKSAVGSVAEEPQKVPTSIERLDPALDQIVPAGAALEKVASGFTWTEGPVWMPSGYLMFADIPSNTIRKWTEGADVSIFMQPSGYKGSAPFGGTEPGSNGMTLDGTGRLTVAGHARQNVWRLEQVDAKATITVLADSYQGK